MSTSLGLLARRHDPRPLSASFLVESVLTTRRHRLLFCVCPCFVVQEKHRGKQQVSSPAGRLAKLCDFGISCKVCIVSFFYLLYDPDGPFDKTVDRISPRQTIHTCVTLREVYLVGKLRHKSVVRTRGQLVLYVPENIAVVFYSAWFSNDCIWLKTRFSCVMMGHVCGVLWRLSLRWWWFVA